MLKALKAPIAHLLVLLFAVGTVFGGNNLFSLLSLKMEAELSRCLIPDGVFPFKASGAFVNEKSLMPVRIGQ